MSPPRRKPPLWSAVLSQLEPKQVVTLMLAFAGIAGSCQMQKEKVEELGQTTATTDAAFVNDIHAMRMTIDTLKARIKTLEKKDRRVQVATPGGAAPPRDQAGHSLAGRTWRALTSPLRFLLGA